MARARDALNQQGPSSNQWYWIGAERPLVDRPNGEGWRWIDGNEIPSSITSAWAIDMMEGRVREGGCVLMAGDGLRVGDYSAVNPTGIVTGFLVEFESAPPGP
jgi:hypothetical protein